MFFQNVHIFQIYENQGNFFFLECSLSHPLFLRHPKIPEIVYKMIKERQLVLDTKLEICYI